MKVVINAASAKMGGAVNYITNLLRHLPPPESGYRFFVFLPRQTAKLLPDLGVNTKLCVLRSKDTYGWRRLRWEQVTLRRFLRAEKVDLLFSTANFAMLRCPVKQVLLVRNALYFSKVYRSMFLGKHGLRHRLAFALRRWMILQSASSADVVMTPTQAMLDDLRQFVEVDPGKALVNPYGVMPADSSSGGDQRMTNELPQGAERMVRLVYVSFYSEHKNLSTLLKAMPLLNRKGTLRFLLRTTLDPGWEAVRGMVTSKGDLALAEDPQVSPWIQILGPVGREQALELYREGDVFVYPALCESFGHPMAEAMAHGLPIVASDTPVNREVCGDAAVYFDLLSPEDLAQRVRCLSQDPMLMRKLGAAGRERALKLFRWDRHVQRVLECAGATCEGPGSAPVDISREAACVTAGGRGTS